MIAGMANWVVMKYVKANGRCPVDDWRSSKRLTEIDRAAIDAFVDDLEAVQAGRQPPEKLKRYKGTSNLYEMKIRGDRKQLRPLCIVDDETRVIMLIGTVKKSQILSGEVESAEKLAERWSSGNGTAKPYRED